MIDYLIYGAAVFVLIVLVTAVWSIRNKANKPPPIQTTTRRPLRRW